jgi:nucleoid DNA-binding protein
MTLKKRDIARAIHEAEPRISLTEAISLVDLMMDELKHGFDKDGKAMVTNFGTFEVVDRAPRRGVNPASRERMLIPAHRAVTFHPAPALLRAVND